MHCTVKHYYPSRFLGRTSRRPCKKFVVRLLVPLFWGTRIPYNKITTGQGYSGRSKNLLDLFNRLDAAHECDRRIYCTVRRAVKKMIALRGRWCDRSCSCSQVWKCSRVRWSVTKMTRLNTWPQFSPSSPTTSANFTVTVHIENVRVRALLYSSRWACFLWFPGYQYSVVGHTPGQPPPR